MNRRDRRTVIAIVAAAGVVGALAIARGESRHEYARRVLTHRRETESFFRTSDASPFPPAARTNMDPPDYFLPDRRFVVEAVLAPVETAEVLLLPTSTGGQDRYTTHSHAVFTWEGAEHQLLLLKSDGTGASNRLFLAFTDATSGDETYGGGRYLDLFPQGTGRVTIDFNLAYNPYCVYNPDYSCPLAPLENHLQFAVKAGEKSYPTGG